MPNTYSNTEFNKPFNDLTKFIPAELKNEMNVSLMDNLFNRFMTHDESVPLYGYIGVPPGGPDDKTPRIPQLNAEREINAITPVISFRTGENEHLFTVQDLIRRAKSIGVSDEGNSWFYSQGNNFVPPINLDKFVNFYDYFWVANTLDNKPEMAWNPDLDPEYYVIAQPAVTDRNKMSARVATTEPIVLTGSGFNKMNFILKFTSPTTFTITVDGSLGNWTPVYNGQYTLASFDQPFAYQVTNGSLTKTLITFNITRDIIYNQDGQADGNAGFDTGDQLTIDATFLSRNYSVKFKGSVGVKGKITRFAALNDYQRIDGVLLTDGDRVLVKNQGPEADGIYIVSAGVWARANDFLVSNDSAMADARIWIRQGEINGSTMWVSSKSPGGFSWTQDTTATVANTNDWQEGNFWVSASELATMGYLRDQAVQATRPIIEYNGALQLNEYVDDTGLPSDQGHRFLQAKTNFDQLPLFDLYRYDGTHAGLVSSVFYYEEDMTNILDIPLQKRVDRSNNESRDYIFNHGMYDEGTGQLLFVKIDGDITSIWHAGYTEATLGDVYYSGEVGTAQMTDLKIVNPETPQQVWTITALPVEDSAIPTFKVVGTRNLECPDATLGDLYDNGEVSFTIIGEVQPGDSFKFAVGNLERPQYVYMNEQGQYVTMLGGPEADTEGKGAYQVSRTFINNPYLDSRSPMTEGIVNTHFRSILDEQINGAPINYALGGTVKLWGEQQTLMASMLMQRDMTPISMIDLAERMYLGALNSVSDIYKQNIAVMLGKMGSVKDMDAVKSVLDQILAIHSKSEMAKSVLFDTTSPVVGFPATLPQMACAELVQPRIEFNAELGIQVIVHHDGHMSELYEDTEAFRQAILGNFIDKTITRADGTETSVIGSFSQTPPANPYKGELWRTPNGGFFSFAVDSDATEMPLLPTVGFTWYDRKSKTLFQWAGSDWSVLPTNSAWQTVNFANILNLLILEVENRLYNGINPNARKINFDELEADELFNSYLKDELYTFSALNGYDPTGSDYVAVDALTWNYSHVVPANAAPIDGSVVPARWFNFLMSHQSTVTDVLPTAQPQNEPWKLMGFEDGSVWWNSLTDAQRTAFTPAFQISQLPNMTFGGKVTVVSTAAQLHPLSGLITVDGVALKAGDTLLITNDTSALNNGVWQVASDGWRRVSYLPAVAGTYYTVSFGEQFSNTVWGLKNDATPGTDPFNIGQVRVWSTQMWEYIQAARPGLKLSVDTLRDTLLPPYVKVGTQNAVNALTNVLPGGVALPYTYGQDAPVESIWKHTAEYLYSRVRALFRYDPLMFLGMAWGFNWVEVDDILYDGFDVAMPGVKRFRLHGDVIPLIGDRAVPVLGALDEPLIFTYTAYDEDRKQNFTLTNLKGDVLGYFQEGVEYAIDGATFKIEDDGIPFRIGDRFEYTADGVGMFVPTATNKILGFGQIFTDALRDSSVDTTTSYALEAYRGWDVHMSYRAGGLVSTDDLQVFTDNLTLGAAAYQLLFKKNPMARDAWAHSFRISVQQFGASIIDGDTGIHRPAGDGSDWTFRIEGYNPRMTKVEVFNFDTSKELVTFRSLGGETTDIEWTRPTIHTSAVPRTVQLPITITGVQNVVNFLFGYLDAATEAGWVFNDGGNHMVDAGTGRTRTMQLEIEKYINDCFKGISASQASIVNPFIDTAWFRQETGLLAEFNNNSLFDMTGHPGVFDMLGVKYNRDDLNIIRRNDQSSIAANGPMFSIHAQVDEYEHLFRFSYFAQPSDKSGLLYDPFSGSHILTYRFNGRKQQTGSLRPEFGGHYLIGSEVFQGLQASTDNMANFYDANHVFENETTTRSALALLGFTTKEYFDDLDISSKTQFNFWRGLIQAKGTNMSIDAYLNNNRFDDAKIDEYWAYKVAEYGDSRPRFYPELKLSVDDALTQFTQLWFDPAESEDPVSDLDMKSFIPISRFNEDRWFSIDDLDRDTYFEAMQVGNYTNEQEVGDIVIVPFVADTLVPFDGCKFTYINDTTIRVTEVPAGKQFGLVGYGAATPKFNPVKLFNYVANELVAEIPFWHPAAGAHTPQAMDSVNVISSFNPARFNTSTLIANSNTFDPLRAWGKNEVGRTWLDTTNMHYVPYYDKIVFKTLGERLSRWGTLADYGSVDVYEWVESSVPPDQYDALAREQAGDANLSSVTKAAGEVGFPQYYSRDRAWAMRPIAWHYSPVPLDVDFGGTPPFPGGSSMTGLRLNEGGLAILDSFTFSSLNITAGMHIGAWDTDELNPKPMNEYLIQDRFTKYLCDADGVFADCGKFNVTHKGLSINACLTPDDSRYNPKIVGQLVVQALEPSVYANATNESGAIISRVVETLLKITNIATGETETITATSGVGTNSTGPTYGASIEVIAGQAWSFEFPRLGLSLTVTTTSDGTFPAEVLSEAISVALGNSVWVRDAVVVEPIIAAASDASYLTNDPDQAALLTTYGWRAWSVPTQADLNNDGLQPVSSWKPYVGDWIDVPNFSYAQLQQATAYAEAPLTLNNGVEIARYESLWSAWQLLEDSMVQITQVGADGPVTFEFEDRVPVDRTGVFVNGAQLLTSGYVIDGKTIVVSEVKTGHTATVVIRKYQPTQEELAFDPDIQPDLKRQQQFKLDYEYVSQPVRGQSGGIESYLYYFWVRNKTTAAVGKRMSIQAVTLEMTRGPANYLTFQHLLEAESGLPYRYDAVTISGLSNVVTKDDTFKLRFTRDFTLRDDPMELDLKNVHTEWTLIRPGQRTRIPEKLWQKLTDSVVGEDIAGNAVPSIRRVLYDERHGTRTQFGFDNEQTLAPSDLLKASLVHSIINTKLVDTSGLKPIPDQIEGLDYDAEDMWFADAVAARKTMTDIWNNAIPEQINEIFFGVLDDILASNYELTDLFKTSRLSAYSIKVVKPAASQLTTNDQNLYHKTELSVPK